MDWDRNAIISYAGVIAICAAVLAAFLGLAWLDDRPGYPCAAVECSSPHLTHWNH